ncbi:hypothetical protein D3C85_1714560 [compost metagenome]
MNQLLELLPSQIRQADTSDPSVLGILPGSQMAPLLQPLHHSGNILFRNEQIAREILKRQLTLPVQHAQNEPLLNTA